MAVPVQTWGTLGTMVAEQREFGQKTAEYLESNEVHDLFGHLLRQLLIHQPDKPIKFLQEQLAAKPPLTVCVIGPPGINRSRYCQLLAEEHKIKHIHVGKLLKAKKDLKDTIEAGELVEDSIVIDLVKAELSKEKKGWVLDGFPRTKVQAQMLAQKECGFCLDKILLLNTSENAIRERYNAKIEAAGYNVAEMEETINSRLQQYHRHVITIVELFKNVVRQIDAGGGDENATYGTIKTNLHIRPFANHPLRHPRICIVGPCGSGRTTQCKIVAEQYGLVHIDLPKLLRDGPAPAGTAEVPPEFVSDEELCRVVGKRLQETDCVRKGWVLDGFPKTQAQAEFLRQSHLWPTRLIHLKCPDPEVIKRVSNRRIDPVTGIAYYKSPNSVAVRQRLVQAEHDTAENVMKRIKLHDDNVGRVMGSFAVVSSTVQAGVEVSVVSRGIAKNIDQPLPSELAQDPTTADE
eukprot:gnl/TRDRNA2_/TRDRNA2_182477_c0_seq1.p1 gnl/TRDRNA2_/TRDRNA2_182477_c0~~gnl/TRDRNA2_/TRDRNA2_182477_c0_seq1.p1  ORF type:complete len:462 (-),score=103.43 gnl/TRDRNA2_/TRDRNA2_182477_c0_seq1:147-1532(-)